MKQKMWNLTIRIKKNDEIKGKRLQTIILDILMNAGIAGATIWTGVNGFGKRGKSTMQIEGISFNMPLLIEVIDKPTKLEPLLAEIKKIIGDNGLISINEVYVI
jgi:PII-like signaling protein